VPVETDTEALRGLTDQAIRNGTRGLKTELERLYDIAWKHATEDECQFLPVIQARICRGSLAELMQDRYKKMDEFLPLLSDLADCLCKNQPYVSG
jgi:hypothetical protein